MEFVLLKKLAKLEGTELWMFIGAIVAVAALIAVLARVLILRSQSESAL